MCYVDYTTGSKPYEITKWTCTETSWQSFDVTISCGNIVDTTTSELTTTEAPCCNEFRLVDQTNTTIGLFSYDDESIQEKFQTVHVCL